MAAAYPDPEEDSQPDNTPSLSTTCPVCEDDFTVPKILPCAHRLCRKCLVTWLTSSKAPPCCPLCQRKLHKKTSGQATASAAADKQADTVGALVDDLPTDIALASLVACAKKLRPPLFCDVCKRRESASDICLQCGDRLCSGCLRCHNAMGGTRNHEVKPISTLTPRQLALWSPEMCPAHPGQYLDVYCPSHGQPLCFACAAENHKSCKPAETIVDAAKRQRGIVQAQVDKLSQAIADVKRRQFVNTECVKKCNADLAVLISRLTGALQAREQQLQTQITNTRMPLQQNLHHRGKDLQDWQTLAVANKVLVSQMMMSASDVNLLRVSGSLATRAARLTADVTQSLAETKDQRLVLDIDQYDVLKVEELLRNLGTVELTEDSQTDGPANFLPPKRKASRGNTGVDPFDSDFRNVGQVTIDNLLFDGCIICAADKDTIATSDNKSRSISYMRTFHPYENGIIKKLKCEIRDLSNLEEGLVAVVTDEKSLHLIHVKNQQFGLSEVSLPKKYKAAAPGLNDTIILSPEEGRGALDVISRDGLVLSTIVCGCSPRRMVRAKNYIWMIPSESSSNLCKVQLDGTSRTDVPCPCCPLRSLYVDHHGNLHVLDDYSNLSIMNARGDWRSIHVVNMGGIVVTKDGRAFTLHCSAGEPVPVLVHELKKI